MRRYVTGAVRSGLMVYRFLSGDGLQVQTIALAPLQGGVDAVEEPNHRGRESAVRIRG